MGYKSVAHYLIQTHRSEANPVNNQEILNEVSVKRSLAFSDVEPVSKDSVKVTDDKPGSPEEFKDKDDKEFENNNDAQDSAKRSLLFSDVTPALESAVSQIEDTKDELFVGKISLEKEIDQENTTTPKLKKICTTIVTVNLDCIAERLKQRRRKSNEWDEEISRVNQEAVKGVLTDNAVKKHLGDGNIPTVKTPKFKQKRALAIVPSEDSIAGRLRQRRK